ncbi:MAG: 16S rRNA (adenine(1518)-N(6)/adenine(1519)-N(6))-dimethyltransferase RsmA [Bacillota bacterium]|nr:16S rRNA (adenine(1518)-N(6)/adenine(1519)-N(6))-dimethyltransferase RsmA [Bacillota bacterium]
MRRPLGQHFLRDERVLARIAGALDLQVGDGVVEIGAGEGALTRHLLAQGARVRAVEVDPQMAPFLESLAHQHPGLELVWADARRLRWEEVVADPPWKATGNLPYYAATPILTSLLEAGHLWERIVAMVQKEVALRMAAPPGSPAYGSLSLFCQYYARVEMLFTVAPGSFRPPPKVESAVVRLWPRQKTLLGNREDEEKLFRLVRWSFATRRKTILNALRGGSGLSKADLTAILEKSGVDPQKRAQELTLWDFVALFSHWPWQGGSSGMIEEEAKGGKG